MRPITLTFTLLVSLHLLPGTAVADSGGSWTWPVRGPVLGGYRNGADPYAAGQHRGVDIGSPVGARVVAATRGTVTFVGVVGSSGLTVAERTADGSLDLSYLHLASAAVHRGDAVAAGDALGTVGTSGRRSVEEPHLHFGVRAAGSHIAYRDPLDFLAPPPVGDAPEPTPAPVPVAHPAAPQDVPAAATQPAAPEGASGTAQAPLPVAPAPAHAALGHPAMGPGHGTAPGHVGQSAAEAASRPLLVRGAVSHAGRHGAAVATPARSGLGAHASPTGGSRPSATAAPRGPAAVHESAAEAAAGRAGHSPDHGGGSASHHGIDVGWLAACLGLVAAATALGHPDATRRIAGRGRARIGTMFRLASRGS